MAIDTPPPTPSLPRWLTLGVLLTSLFMDMVDGNIVGVVLPHLQDDLGTSYAAAQWVMAGYSLAFGVVLITGGRLGDVYGRKKVFLVGVAGFTLASALCGAATDAALMIGARLGQGAMAALMVPQVLASIMVTFHGKERGKAFMAYGLVLGLASVSGALLGGLLTSYDVLGLGWRAIFYVNVPIGLAGLVLGLLFMPENRSAAPPRLDLPGVGLITLASLCLMYPLIQGRERGWPPEVLALLCASLPLVVLFALHQRRRERTGNSPLVPSALFRQRSFVVGVVLSLIMFSGLASFFVVLTYTVQSGLGWSAIRTAVATLGWPIGLLVTSVLTRPYAATHGRRLIGIGASTMAAGMVLLVLFIAGSGLDLGFWQVELAATVSGLGLGCCAPILTGVVLGDVATEHAGAGSGVVNAVLQIGTALGVAISGLIFFGLSTATIGTSVATVVPALRTELAQAHVPADRVDPLLTAFEACVQAREDAGEPGGTPPECRTGSGTGGAAVTEALTAAGSQAHALAMTSAAWRALLYNVVVFLLGALLSPLLPRRSNDPSGPMTEQHGTVPTEEGVLTR